MGLAGLADGAAGAVTTAVPDLLLPEDAMQASKRSTADSNLSSMAS
eukprot:CAMPEP_0119114372 /NCGR_PEP_ID=MMETSP1180-20130426/47309_1 /TAXON_ID=3052 ORGANISM="Chlamydomonas cf sp, Strain CCMP681" /NCGR_SAMPLE_ID=MMETSP1180 /ASSEMBLY_ACC=CAM_ASM_000741 /LENGTH=45 /DNA_ID= /DNA_START= /DNA_END= /DNA_ORIENTATION=